MCWCLSIIELKNARWNIENWTYSVSLHLCQRKTPLGALYRTSLPRIYHFYNIFQNFCKQYDKETYINKTTLIYKSLGKLRGDETVYAVCVGFKVTK